MRLSILAAEYIDGAYPPCSRTCRTSRSANVPLRGKCRRVVFVLWSWKLLYIVEPLSMVCETGEGVPNHPRFGTSCGIIVPPIRIITEQVSHNGAYYTIFSDGIWSLAERQFISGIPLFRRRIRFKWTVALSEGIQREYCHGQ